MKLVTLASTFPLVLQKLTTAKAMKKNNFVVRYRAFFLVAVLSSAVILSCKESDKDLVKPKTITDVLLENEQFSIFREILVTTKLADGLRTDNVTLFAPNNAAFLNSKITAAQILAMPKDSTIWFVNHHIIPSIKKYADLKSEKIIAVNKDTLNFQKSSVDSAITVNGAIIVTKDIHADNGYIQVINSVLLHK